MHASASVALLLCLVHSSAAFAPPVEGPGRGGVSARALPRLSQPCVPLRRVVPVPRLPRRPPARLPPRVPPETVGTAPRAGDGDAAGGARPEIAALKQRLVEAVRAFKAVQARDGAVSVDFGVGGGELDGDTRAPRNLASAGAFYAVSEELGRAADAVADLVSDLEAHNPTAEPTKYFNTPDGAQCPLHGPWQLFFTTAADASFSSNSTRGDARASNEVDGVAGRITNVITFANRSDGELPVVKELRVELAAEVASRSSITFRFKFVRVYLNSLFGLPIRRLFGRALPLVIPVPGPFLTRILYSVRRVFGQKGSEPPKPRFEVLFLDQELRIHRTGEGNIFVQGRPHWLESISS